MRGKHAGGAIARCVPPAASPPAASPPAPAGRPPGHDHTLAAFRRTSSCVLPSPVPIPTRSLARRGAAQRERWRAAAPQPHQRRPAGRYRPGRAQTDFGRRRTHVTRHRESRMAMAMTKLRHPGGTQRAPTRQLIHPPAATTTTTSIQARPRASLRATHLVHRHHLAVVVEPVALRAQDLHLRARRRNDIFAASEGRRRRAARVSAWRAGRRTAWRPNSGALAARHGPRGLGLAPRAPPLDRNADRTRSGAPTALDHARRSAPGARAARRI